MSLIAKPVIDKQFWILQDGQQKVGNIEACAGGYQVKINNQVAQFKTIKMAAQRVNIEFESSTIMARTKSSDKLVHGYPAAGRVCNPMWDVKLKLPVYTKTAKSKSWFAAGWYQVRKGRNWAVIQDPKLIVLQRYSYAGPFHSDEAANDHTPTKIC
jgi:uncharacterized membrane protein